MLRLKLRRRPRNRAVALIQRRFDERAGYARIVHKQHQRIAFAIFDILRRKQVVAHGFARLLVGVFALDEIIEHLVDHGAGLNGLRANVYFGSGGFERGRAVALVARLARAVFGRGGVGRLVGGTAFFHGKQRALVIGIERKCNVMPSRSFTAIFAVGNS